MAKRKQTTSPPSEPEETTAGESKEASETPEEQTHAEPQPQPESASESTSEPPVTGSMPPPASAVPATAAPESTPEKAGSKPASKSRARRKEHVPGIDWRARAKPDPFNIPTGEEKFKGHEGDYVEEMSRIVPCQFITELRGRLGLRCQFDYKRGEVVLLPKWFAVTYPNSIVIKEA